MANNPFALPNGAILVSEKRNYKVVKVLGSGGFGVTYLAKGKIKVDNVWVEGFFAIKELFPSDFSHRVDSRILPNQGHEGEFDKAKADFLLEASRLQSIGTLHDNIVKVNEVFEANGTAYYVMQYVNGRTLYEYVNEYGGLPFDFAYKLIAPIMHAVEFLHQNRINHFDIKPDNVMLQMADDEIQPVLIDFGLSIHYKNDGNKTTARAFGGVSEGYAPIEQYADIKHFSPQTDVYALAATFVYMLTGKQPAPAPTLKIAELRNQLMEKVPENVADAICHAMAKGDDERTPSIARLRDELTGVAAPPSYAPGRNFCQPQPANPMQPQPANPMQPQPASPMQQGYQPQQTERFNGRRADHRSTQMFNPDEAYQGMQGATAAAPAQAPVNPAPVNPAPVNPAPVNPAGVNPAPASPVATTMLQSKYQPANAPAFPGSGNATVMPGANPSPAFPGSNATVFPGAAPGKPAKKNDKKGMPAWIWGAAAGAALVIVVVVLWLTGVFGGGEKTADEPTPPFVPTDTVAFDTIVVVPSDTVAADTTVMVHSDPTKPGDDTTTGQKVTPEDGKPDKEKPGDKVKEEAPKQVSGKGTVGWHNGSYTGQLKNGKPEGKGRVNYTSSGTAAPGDSHQVYPGYFLEGYFSNGKLEQGKLYDNTGAPVAIVVP